MKMANLVCGMPLPRALGKYRIEEVAGEQRAARGQEDTPPSRASGRVHARGDPACEKDESDDHQADQRSDNEAEQHRDAVFTPENAAEPLLKLVHPLISG